MMIIAEQQKIQAQQILVLSKEKQFAFWEEHVVNGWYGRAYKSEQAKKCAFAYWLRFQQRVFNAPVGTEVRY
jgi:hypothetical protein